MISELVTAVATATVEGVGDSDTEALACSVEGNVAEAGGERAGTVGGEAPDVVVVVERSGDLA